MILNQLKKIMVAGAVFTAFIPATVYASDTEDSVNPSTVASSEETEEETEEKTPDFTFGENGEYFRTDEDFQNYFEGIKERYEKNPENPDALIELYHFISGGGANTSQAESVLNEGYLTEYLDDFKNSGVISKDYVLPEGITPISTNITYDENGDTLYDSKGISHYYTEFGKDAIVGISQLLYDDDPDDCYITVYNTEDTPEGLPIMALTTSGYNREALTINFYDNDKKNVAYGWTFEHQIFTDTKTLLNLSVKNEKNTVSFDLGKEMVQPVTVRFDTGSPSTTYTVTDTETGEKQELESDESGILELYDDDGSGIYNYEPVTETGNVETPDVVKKTIIEKVIVRNQTDNTPMSKALIAIISLIAICGLGFIIVGIKRK